MDALISIFEFIYSIFDTIYQGIYGVISIIYSIINFLFSIIRVLPSPLFGIAYAFISVYLVIFIYKIFRQG